MSTGDDRVSRRVFVQAVATAAITTAAVSSLPAAESRHAVVAAIGDVVIPSGPGDPGYSDLEKHGLTEEVLKALPGVSDADADLWNTTAKSRFKGQTFLQLKRAQRAEYVQQVLDGNVSDDPKLTTVLQRVFRNTRRRVVTLYYANFPEHQWPRNGAGMPIIRSGDKHQITNPNTKTLITGWDQSGFFGPLTWQEEERRRNLMKLVKGPRGKDGLDWNDSWSPFDYRPKQPSRA